MEVYLEITYLINALILLTTFEILTFILNVKISTKTLMKYVFTYNISIIFLFYDFSPGMIYIYFFLLTLMYYKKMIYVYFPLIVFIYISLTSFLEYLLPDTIMFQGILLVEGVNVPVLFFIGIFAFSMLFLFIQFMRQRLNRHDGIEVMINGRTCTAIIDTGNLVTYKGYPVIFIDPELTQGLDFIDEIEIETAIASEAIPIYSIPELKVEDKVLNNIYAGTMMTGKYKCILHANLLGGLL